MKILQILPQLNYGGVEVGTIDLAQALIERGHKAYVVSGGGELVGRLIKMGGHHYELPVHRKSPQALALIGKVRSIIEKERIDIVHARSRIPAWIAYFATRRTNAKFITTCHGYYSKNWISAVMGLGERVIVISHAVGRRMIDDFDVPPDRITLIHRGINLKKYTFDKERYSIERLRGKEKFIIANIGRLSPIKGHEYFIKAIHLVSHQFPQIEAWIIGGSAKRKAKYVEQLKILVDKLGIGSKVKFMGIETNVPELLKKVDVLVLSTTHPEGFGRVIIEAGASGIAVVATKVGGVPDIIDHEKNGLLVPPRDEIKMSNAIARVAHDNNFAHSLASQLRKKTETSFTLEKMIDKTIRVYEEVRQARRILIIKLGALGDIILAVPSMRMLRKKYPKAYIAVLVDSDLVACLENCPYIDEVIPFKRKDKRERLKHIKNIIKKLRTYAFDMSVDFQNNTVTHFVGFMGGIPLRYGYRRGMAGRLLTNGIGSFRDPLPPVQHQFRVLSLLGISECDERLELWPQTEDYQYIESLLGAPREEKKEKRVGFVLGASERWRSKKWPIENYLALTKKLTELLDCRIVLIGAASSRQERDYFLSRSTRNVFDLVGRTSVMQLAALVDMLDCVVCGDTAPLHVASAMQTKVVALFGPTDPRRHAPPGPNQKVLRRNLSCSPCYKEECSSKHRCMREISVDEVFEAVKKQVVQ